MDYKDYYKILDVDKKATAKEIKKQYRKMARKHHPDVNSAKESEQKFKDIGEAYEVLKDSEKRKAYDQFGSNWKEGQHQQKHQQQYQQQYKQPQGGGFDFGGGFGDDSQYSDFFENMFGGGRSRRQSASRKTKGDDINATISIPLEDAYTGNTRKISYETQSITPEGQVTSKPVSLNIKIPKGVKDNQKIRLAGQGSPGYNGSPAGDMILTIEIEKHPVFRVDGADVYVDLPVNAWEAALGAKVAVPTPTTTIKLGIPEGTVQGKKLRLKGKGIPSKTPGDMYVVVNIVLPPANTDEAKKVYESMKNLNFDPRENFKK